MVINVKDRTCQVLQTLETRIVSFVSSILRGPVVVYHFREHVCGVVLKASPFGGNTFTHVRVHIAIQMFVNHIALSFCTPSCLSVLYSVHWLQLDLLTGTTCHLKTTCNFVFIAPL